jgi:hypothetical protein
MDVNLSYISRAVGVEFETKQVKDAIPKQL